MRQDGLIVIHGEAAGVSAIPEGGLLVIHVVLFDLDGTLNDSERLGSMAYHAAIEAVVGRGPTEEERIFLMGKPFSALSELFPGYEEAIARRTLAIYEQRNHEIQPYPGVLDLVAHLRRVGIRLGVVTSKVERNALKELRVTGLADAFEAVLTEADTPVHKPDPYPIQLALSQMGVTAVQALYVGDQGTDMEAAAAAGVASVAALWGEGRLERLAPYRPTFVARFPQDLARLVDASSVETAQD